MFTLSMMNVTQLPTGTTGIDTIYYRYLSNKYELAEGIEKVVLPGLVNGFNLTVMGNAGDNDITSGDGMTS